jgi:hypothetical protein
MSTPDEANATESDFKTVAEASHTLFVAIIATNAIRAATDEEFREDLELRSELREDLSAPEWIPDSVKPYYNIVSWRGRAALFVGECSRRSPFNWYRYPVLRRLASWSVHADVTPRWKAHEDWPTRLTARDAD